MNSYIHISVFIWLSCATLLQNAMTSWSIGPFRATAFVCGCSVCGRDELELLQLAFPTDVADEFVRCQCTLCGNGGCRVLVHPVRCVSVPLRMRLADGHLADIDPLAMPYCADCQQHRIEVNRQRIEVNRLKRKQDQLEERRRRRQSSATEYRSSKKITIS